MTTTRTYKNITWVDMIAPTPEEVRNFIEKYKINADISKDLVLPSPKPQVQYYDNIVYLVLHFPVRKHSHHSPIQEVDFLIGKDFIATIHYEAFDPIEEFSKYAEVSHILDTGELPHAGYFFFEMLKHIYGSIRDDVTAVGDDIKEAEPRIFSGKEKEVMRTLLLLSRSLLGFKEALTVHKEILELFAVYGKSMFGKSFDHISFVLLGEYQSVMKEVEHMREVLRELRETNNTFLSTKQNEIMKNIAMVSFVTFPLSLIVAIFALAIAAEGSFPYEFWIVVIILVVSTIGMFAFFKKKQWL